MPLISSHEDSKHSEHYQTVLNILQGQSQFCPRISLLEEDWNESDNSKRSLKRRSTLDHLNFGKFALYYLLTGGFTLV